jgi:hypothetical protein
VYLLDGAVTPGPDDQADRGSAEQLVSAGHAGTLTPFGVHVGYR